MQELLNFSQVLLSLPDKQSFEIPSEIEQNKDLLVSLSQIGPLPWNALCLRKVNLYEELHPFEKEQCEAAMPILDYWGFPVQWNLILQKELAFRGAEKYKHVLLHLQTELLKSFHKFTTDFPSYYFMKLTEEDIRILFEHKDVHLSNMEGLSSSKQSKLKQQWKVQVASGRIPSVKPSQAIIDDAKLFEIAAGFGHPHLFVWLASFSEDRKSYTTIMESAAANKNFELVKWLHEQGYAWDAFTFEAMARTGNADMCKWAHEQGCPWDESTCSAFAGAGHFQLLQWAREKGCQWDSNTCSSAAFAGRLDILQWARDNRCNWDEFTIYYAARGGHMHILEWAFSHGAALKSYALQFCASQGHKQSIEWLLSKGLKWCKDSLASLVAADKLELLQWAKEEYQADFSISHESLRYAVHQSNSEIFFWLVKQGCDVHKGDLVSAASWNDKDNLEILNYLLDKNVKYQLSNVLHLAWVHEKHNVLDIFKQRHSKQELLDAVATLEVHDKLKLVTYLQS